MAQTNAHRRLKRWMKKRSLSQAQLAEMLELEQPSISRWMKGARPKPAHREVVALVTGIEADAWMTTEERKMLRRFAESQPANDGGKAA